MIRDPCVIRCDDADAAMQKQRTRYMQQMHVSSALLFA